MKHNLAFISSRIVIKYYFAISVLIFIGLLTIFISGTLFCIKTEWVFTLVAAWFSLHIYRNNYFTNLITIMNGFNSRFDVINEQLNNLLTINDTSKHDNCINDYLNLCSEEFYFYSQGLIPDEIWNSWLSGIQFYYQKSNAIKKYFDEQLKDNSDQYYGFSIRDLNLTPNQN